MRNVIRILDSEIQKPNISNIEVGSMFRYPKGSGDNVYMKITSAYPGDVAVVLLSTGVVYKDFDHSKEIEPVTLIQILR